MKIESVFDASFRQYGKVVKGLHLDELLTALSKTEKPTDGVIYVPVMILWKTHLRKKNWKTMYMAECPFRLVFAMEQIQN